MCENAFVKYSLAFSHILFYMEMKFCERLNELIDEKGITCPSLAKIIKVNVSTIYRWRSGEMYPTIDKLNMLCDFFGVTSDYLLGRED